MVNVNVHSVWCTNELQAATGKAHITIQGGVGNAANSAAVTANLVAMLSKSGDSKKKKAK